MKENLSSTGYTLIIKEIQAFLMFSYVLMIGIGMLFNFKKYATFDINIFLYADVFDFLISPFEDFRIIIFTLISAILVIIFFRIDIFWKRKSPQSYTKANFGFDKKFWYDKFRLFVFSILFILYVFYAADIYAGMARESILEQSEMSIQFADDEIITGIIIGKTKDVIFLLVDGNVKAIPIQSFVKSIDISRDFP